MKLDDLKIEFINTNNKIPSVKNQEEKILYY